MEGLMERLERAVTRLEKLSVSMQESSGVANGGCVNGVDEGKSLFRNEKGGTERTEFLSECSLSDAASVPVCVC